MMNWIAEITKRNFLKKFILFSVAIMRFDAADAKPRPEPEFLDLEAGRYKYAATGIEDGNERYFFYCGNVADGIKDHILMRKDTKVGSQWIPGPEKIAVHPGVVRNSGDFIWDKLHVCDPEVIAGRFKYQGPEQATEEVFNYALFYTGIEKEDEEGGFNQLGWAVAKTLEGPWYKVVGYGPLITANQWWGTGQPSATSIDGKGKILLFYTKGHNGNTTFRRELDLSDANNPIVHPAVALPTNGLTDRHNNPDFDNHGGAFAYDSKLDRFYIIRNGHPYPTTSPDFISSFLQIAYIDGASVWSGKGEWKVLKNITQVPKNKPRIFDGGWIRNKYGMIIDSTELLPIVSTADGAPCNSGPNCIYSYRFHSMPLKQP